MGKALLVIVLGSGLILTKQLYNATEHEGRTNRHQVAYQEEVIAREIASSAFNVGMGEIRAYGDDLPGGVVALNGPDNKGREGIHTSGRFAGGSYTVRAELASHHSVRVIATGRYGKYQDEKTGETKYRAEITMNDNFRLSALVADEESIPVLIVDETKSPGFCAAVFYQAYTLDMPEGTVPEPVMILAPGKKVRPVVQEVYVEAGTQLNFFIAVDENCSSEPNQPQNTCEVRKDWQGYTFNASDFNHIHYALDVSAGQLDQARESIWAVVEQHPTDDQRWRIAWEDIHNASWDKKESKNPYESLQALKTLGYDGLGWPEEDAMGYRLLKNYGNRPDFSDQVIEIQMMSVSEAKAFYDAQEKGRKQQEDCGEVVDDPIIPDPEDPNPPPSTTDEPASDDELTTFACDCIRNSKKVPVLHRPPGNESNEQLLCLPEATAYGHKSDKHNDVFPTCEARMNVKKNNTNK